MISDDKEHRRCIFFTDKEKYREATKKNMTHSVTLSRDDKNRFEIPQKL